MVETQFDTKIKLIKSHNGTEFIKDFCLDVFITKGIFHKKSIVKAPQQNGVAERKHKHLLDIVRALRFHARFPKSFWGECILSTTHIINFLPMENLEWKSPYEMLFGKPPAYQDLKVIACLCFVANLGIFDKVEPRATKCVLLAFLVIPLVLKVTSYILYKARKFFTVEMSFFHKMSFPLIELRGDIFSQGHYPYCYSHL